MKKWEYKSVKFNVGGFLGGSDLDKRDLDGILYEFGKQGWELVNCFPVNSTHGATDAIFVVFKRAVCEEMANTYQK